MVWKVGIVQTIEGNIGIGGRKGMWGLEKDELAWKCIKWGPMGYIYPNRLWNYPIIL